MAERDLTVDDFEIEDDLDDNIEPDQPLREPPAVQVGPGGVRMEQRRFTGGDTLDEPVSATLLRDLQTFKRLAIRTCGWNPSNADDALRREWDLWGPLVMSLSIALLVGLRSDKKDRSSIFSLMFSEIWVGQLLVTGNIKLLGGSIGPLQALCITGYSLLPVVIAAGISMAVKNQGIRIAYSIPLALYAVWVARRGLGFAGVPDKRIFLAVYPVGLFYISLAWMSLL